MLTEEFGTRMEVLEDGRLQVCKVTHIMRDGNEIARQLHRYILEPGQDTTQEADRVKMVAATVWTKDVVDEFKAKKEASINELVK